MKRILLWALALAVALPAAARTPNVKHVVLIGSDGFSAEVVVQNPGKFPNIERLMRTGSWTLEARSVLPSSSAINWATMLMGAGSEVHGFTTWGSKTPEVKPAYTTPEYGMFPSIFGQVRNQKPQAVTGVFYTWDGIGYLFERQAVDKDVCSPNDDKTTAAACAFIAAQKPTLTFVCLGEPDGAGHSIGWSTPEYVAACVKIDSLVGDICRTATESLDPKQTVVIFTSDHGGIEKGHGGKTMSEMEVPWVAVGPGIKANYKIDRVVMKYDTAPTLAALLGITAPEVWYGKSVLRK